MVLGCSLSSTTLFKLETASFSLEMDHRTPEVTYRLLHESNWLLAVTVLGCVHVATGCLRCVS